MTPAGDGRTGRDRDAEALLARLLPDQDWMTVLEYSRANHLESDNAVFFLVALLKLFAVAYDRILDALGRVSRMQSEIELSAISAERRLDHMLERHHALIARVMEEQTALMGHHAQAFTVTTGEMRLLRTMLDASVRDARETLRSLAALKAEDGDKSLARMFRDRLEAALAARVPAFDQVFHRLILDTIADGMGRYFVIVQLELAAIAVGLVAAWHWIR